MEENMFVLMAKVKYRENKAYFDSLTNEEKYVLAFTSGVSTSTELWSKQFKVLQNTCQEILDLKKEA